MDEQNLITQRIPRRLFIITGLSGSGKSSVLHFLEDQGLFTVDNLLVGMLTALMRMLENHPQAVEHGVGVVIDARSTVLREELEPTLQELRSDGIQVTVVFLEASEAVLLKRYNFTRRRHPAGFASSLSEGIEAEKHELSSFRSLADRIIDTSSFSVSELRGEIFAMLGLNPAELHVTVCSFGFKYGVPVDADFVIDVRFLANPYYDAALRELCGKDEPVQRYIYENCDADGFLQQCYKLFEGILPAYHSSGKNFIQIAIGCTGGQHRSVFVAECLAKHICDFRGVTCAVRHRDLDRMQLQSPQSGISKAHP